MDTIQKQDVDEFVHSFSLGNELNSSRFLITGATGLIGSTLIHCLIALNQNVYVIAAVRDVNKAKAFFDEQELKCITFIEGDIIGFDSDVNVSADYLIHCASPTDSSFFIEHPTETFDVILKGSQALLEYARKHVVKGVVFLSSLEVYGTILDDTTVVKEDCSGYIDSMSVRSCYPIAKRAVENLCCLYAKEYNIPIKVARLTQTTGPNISDNDNRVIAQFCRLASKDSDIILHTDGTASRPYCYTIDCVSAILYILLKGESGEAYNVANEETYISAYDMAKYIKENFNPDIDIRFEKNGDQKYAPTTKLRLSSEKLLLLGWTPMYGLYSIFERLINSLKTKM